MPSTTRQQAKQALINPENVTAPVKAPKRKAVDSDSQTSKKKTKTEAKPSEKPTAQKSKPDTEANAEPDDKDVIVINRAPVLELWAASVTSFLYEELAWETCLSIGGAISTLCAISKGRSIGAIEPADPGAAEKKREERRKRAEKQQLDEVEVMGFELKLKDGNAVVGDKPKKPNESTLQHKFGEDSYQRTKTAYSEALETWKGSEEDLDAHAFKMYEDFRPTVPPGQKGWGRKGQLSLQTVKDAVSKST